MSLGVMYPAVVYFTLWQSVVVSERSFTDKLCLPSIHADPQCRVKPLFPCEGTIDKRDTLHSFFIVGDPLLVSSLAIKVLGFLS